MRPTLIALAALALAGCSNGETAATPEIPPAPAAPTILGDVDLNQEVRALGTEPFWNLRITPDSLAYTAVDQPDLTVPNPGPTLQGTTAVYAAAAPDGTALVVTLIATECSDGMSDRVYPLTARVERGAQTLNGCAASGAFLDSQPAP